jgi:hypothetical protein
MPANDPATDRRISRLSLISSGANLYSQKIADPNLVLAAAQMWETWVYSGQATLDSIAAAAANGVEPTPVPIATGPVCAECGNPLTEVQFKTGKTWTVQQLADFGMGKYGKFLCKQHYFGSKAKA